ncbi:MAG TPA: DUF2520 domain-containing protein [Gemmatimonadales bacterium]|nr:DUF2520 domain-containing protein [Gemmatimonadales bacterium]
MSSARPAAPRVAIIGAGRAGRALALALTRAMVPVHVCVRRPTDLPSPIECSLDPWNEVLAQSDIVLLAVPDDAIGDVATAIREATLAQAVVLHCSGLRDRSALAALEGCAKGLGSFHPLQTLAGDSEAAGRLRASFAVLEGDAAAVEAGRRLAAVLGMEALVIDSAQKPRYHAAAVMVSNYTVTLAAIGAKLAREAGVPAEAASRIFLPLLEGTVKNLEALGPASALTGPIRRGDIGTIEAHLAALDGGDRRLYAELGLRAVELAREAGLDEERAAGLAARLRAAVD